MRNLTILLLGLASVVGSGNVCAQIARRPESPALGTDRITEIQDQIPCNGTVLFDEGFENGIPSGWTVIDGDTLTPRMETGLVKGWQSRADYRDSLNNKVVCSPSWYLNPGQSNDWLISPAIVVGNNSCLSWKAYSQDIFFKENYEVRIANQADTTSFLANAPLMSITSELGNPHYASASLAAYAGQTVYIAFRQTSLDKFVLCLDDVRVSNVNTIDIGVLGVTYPVSDPGDSVKFRFQVANYGSDTITSFQALYRVDGGPAKVMTISAVSLPPNSTVFFNHDSLYVSDTLDGFHALCAWTNLPNAVIDQDVTNDTSCITVTIGNPVSAPNPEAQFQHLEVYPNPFNDQLHLRMQALRSPVKGVLRLSDLQGKTVLEHPIQLSAGAIETLHLRDLEAGMYFLQIQVNGQMAVQRKILKD